MRTHANQPWDFGQAVAELSSGIVKGLVVFFGLVAKSFDSCGLGHESEITDNEHTEDDGPVVSPADGRPGVHGGPSKCTDSSSPLTEETLGTLSLVDGLACRGSTSSVSSSSSSSSSINTLDISTESSFSGSVSSEGGRIDDGVISSRTKPRVTFDYDVTVRITWKDHLTSADHEEGAGRSRAQTMRDGDDFFSIIESSPSKTFVQPQRTKPIVQRPRVYSRAAYFAMKEDVGDHRENGHDARKPIAYGRMKEIVSSSRGGITGNGGEEEEGEEEGLSGLFGSYDGSFASMKDLVFPPTFSSSRYINGRPVKRLFDSSALASRSRAEWMTSTELDDILSRTKGWKEGAGASSNGRSGGRRARRKKSYDDGIEGRLDSRNPVRHELARVSVDNTVLKDELFGLAMEEHRTSLLFKRAFLNWEGSASEM